jgi:hypothetical protein
MSVVEDVRQIIQDFLAPELRAIAARQDRQDKIGEARHNELLARLQALQNTVDAKRRDAPDIGVSLPKPSLEDRLLAIEKDMRSRRGCAA